MELLEYIFNTYSGGTEPHVKISDHSEEKTRAVMCLQSDASDGIKVQF